MTGADLIAAQERNLARVKRFARQLCSLDRMGLDRRYLMRLAAEGPASLPQVVEAIAYKGEQ